MKFTAVLFRRPSRVLRKRILYQTKGIYLVHPQENAALLESLGKEVIDVTSPDVSKHLHDTERAKAPPSTETKPKLSKRFIAGQGPIYVDANREKKHNKPHLFVSPDERKVEVCHLSTHHRFTEDIKQACLLTKTKWIKGLPPSIHKQVGQVKIPDQDELVQRLILQSQVWDNTAIRLGRRIDKENIRYKFKPEYGIPNSKSAKTLIHNFIRLAMGTAETHPGVVNERQLLYKPNLTTAYHYKDELIRVHAVNECLITGMNPLKAPADLKEVNHSRKKDIPNMFPINPTIDLERLEVPPRTLISNGAFNTVLDDKYPKYPHIIFRTMNFNWWPVCNQAYNLMLCFATAITEARTRFGIDFDPDDKSVSSKSVHLPEPIVIHNINTDFQKMNFLTFQLNTLDLSNNDGIKNIAWFDTGNKLFDRKLPKPWKGDDYLKTQYSNYNPDVFKKFLAMFLDGVKEEKDTLWKLPEPKVEVPVRKFKWLKL